MKPTCDSYKFYEASPATRSGTFSLEIAPCLSVCDVDAHTQAQARLHRLDVQHPCALLAAHRHGDLGTRDSRQSSLKITSLFYFSGRSI